MHKSMALFLVLGLGGMPGHAQVTNADGPRLSLGVATIKPTADRQAGGLIRMEAGRFTAKNQPLRALIAVAYNLTSGEVSGGPTWVDSDHYDISGVVPGVIRTTPDTSRAILQKFLADRFKLTFHREQKEVTIYALTVAESGSKLKESSTVSSRAFSGQSLGPRVGIVVYPESIVLPGHKATMADLSSMLQRFTLDCPVIDKTGLSGKYNFELRFTPDSSQFSGSFKEMNIDNFADPDLFIAIQEQLGLKLEPTKRLAEVLVIDSIERPSEN
jgi:uncharacterized protein (TIGR03435 family)